MSKKTTTKATEGEWRVVDVEEQKKNENRVKLDSRDVG